MIPVLDWSTYATDPEGFTAKLGQACRDTGFFLLKGHGVPDDLIAGVFAQADTFFSKPDAEKQPLSISKNPHNRGWARIGSESLDDTSGQIDSKEAFNVGLDLAEDDLLRHALGDGRVDRGSRPRARARPRSKAARRLQRGRCGPGSRARQERDRESRAKETRANHRRHAFGTLRDAQMRVVTCAA